VLYYLSVERWVTPNVVQMSNRDVAQLGSALLWGSRGRKFKSCHSDYIKPALRAGFVVSRVHFKPIPSRAICDRCFRQMMNVDPRNVRRDDRMTFTKARFASFEEYLTADGADLLEGRCEYWDGELVPVMAESLLNEMIANYLYLVLWQMGIDSDLISPGKVEIVVSGRPKTRYPDLTLLDESHLVLMESSTRLGTTMPAPQLVVEVISPGDEDSENYIRDYQF
jgi:Uma2 family endonuclease